MLMLLQNLMQNVINNIMKKIVTIILAICALITSVTTAVWYACDNDPTTEPDVKQVIKDYQEVKAAINQKADNK